MLWRIFFCCSVATFWLSILTQIHHNILEGHDLSYDLVMTSAGTLKFGSLQNIKEVQLYYIHGAIVLGIIGGALGSLFINVNTRMSRLRKKIIKTTTHRVIETGCFAALTISAWVACTQIMLNCKNYPTVNPHDVDDEMVFK